jgi:hypothetical protein
MQRRGVRQPNSDEKTQRCRAGTNAVPDFLVASFNFVKFFFADGAKQFA